MKKSVRFTGGVVLCIGMLGLLAWRFFPAMITSSDRTVGLFLNSPQAFDGYTLFAPMHSNGVYLIDNQGRRVHSWQTRYSEGGRVHLLPNGHLLRNFKDPSKGWLRGLEEYDWDGNLVWECYTIGDNYGPHHDMKVLPNGNVLMIVGVRIPKDKVLEAGISQSFLKGSELIVDAIIEVQPIRPQGGKVVWQWHVMDHLVQEKDPGKSNYGKIADHPELISVDAFEYGEPDQLWNHSNSLDYNPELDQILLSVRNSSEVWVIDHSTTTEQAKGHTGGRYGKGGDLLYRWGNPRVYGRGTADNQMLFHPHDAQWIPPGYPGAGNILVFNNGVGRPGTNSGQEKETSQPGVHRKVGYSSVDEFVPPVDSGGNYFFAPGVAYGPSKLQWTSYSRNPAGFFAPTVSGCQRLPNGNTLVCDGHRASFFEVTPRGEVIWNYASPVVRGGILAQGELPGRHIDGRLLNGVFKIRRYTLDYAAFAGKDLSPKGVIELPPSQKGKTGLDRRDTKLDEVVPKNPGDIDVIKELPYF